MLKLHFSLNRKKKAAETFTGHRTPVDSLNYISWDNSEVMGDRQTERQTGRERDRKREVDRER